MVLGSEERLRAWENAGNEPPLGREVALAVAFGAGESETLPAVGMGDFHRKMLECYGEQFGREAGATAHCPKCSAGSEFSVDLGKFVEAQTPAIVGELCVGGYQLSVRLPTVGDLLAAGAAGNVEAARKCLIGRCVVRARRGDLDIAAESLPAEIITAIESELAKADPLGRFQMHVSCPECGHSWLERLDLGAFFWSGLEDSVTRILRDVDVVARAYGWSEREILALSASRRKTYVAMIESGTRALGDIS
jgi:hypothetical protein